MEYKLLKLPFPFYDKFQLRVELANSRVFPGALIILAPGFFDLKSPNTISFPPNRQ